MTIRTGEQFLAGLRHDRRVHYKGRWIEDVTSEPDLVRAAKRSALAFDLQHDPSHRSDFVQTTEGQDFSALYTVPSSLEDLQHRARLVETSSEVGGCMILLKEVGSDALVALLSVLEGDGLKRVMAFHQQCRNEDRALAVAQTDVKGDRSLPPHLQRDPDLYLRVVGEEADHLVVRGAKCHTSFSPNVDEIIVLPTRAMGQPDRDYALSFAVPVDTPGLSLYVSPYLGSAVRNEFEHPMSSRYSMVESLTVFDDVKVPKDRVFVDRQPEVTGPLVTAFVNYHRLTAVLSKLPLIDLMVGAAFLVAEANGIAKAGHVRDKLARLVHWAESVRALAEVAVVRSFANDAGIQVPDPLAVNMAKYEFAHGFAAASSTLIDLAGGLLVTGPGGQDWDDLAIRAVLEKYYAAAVPGDDRLKVMNLIADLTARDYGGYQSVLATHAEGSLEAEKLQMLRSYPTTRATTLARRLAGLAAPDRQAGT